MQASTASVGRTVGGLLRRNNEPSLRPLLQPVMLLVLPCALSILLASGAHSADIVIPPMSLPKTTTGTPATTTGHLSTSQTPTQHALEETSSHGISTVAASWTSASASTYDYTQGSTSNFTNQKYLEPPSENGLIVGASVGTAVFLVAVSAVVLGLLYSQGLIGSSAKAFTPVPTQPPPV